MAQLVPNGIRILVVFVLTCLQNKIIPTLDLFRYFFQLKKAAQTDGYYGFASRGKFKILVPDNNAGWKPRFTFVKIGNSFLPEEFNPRDLVDRLKNRNKNIPLNVEGLKNIGQVDGRRLHETLLIKYGINPGQSVISTGEKLEEETGKEVEGVGEEAEVHESLPKEGIAPIMYLQVHI
ncbi:hypothetical protein BHUM_05666 [Candidatus Burkholderia humilis]|nr:hypothetical protein BHUM_05666 [Candidatus Burkholderia humilis]